MAASKIAVIQDSKFRDERNNNNETSIFLPKNVIDEMKYIYTQETPVSFYIYKQDFIQSLGVIMNLRTLPLYSKQEPLNLDVVFFINALKEINDFFNTEEIKIYSAVYEPNNSQNLRGYYKNLNNDGFNIRNYIVQNHTVLSFEKRNNRDVVRLKTFIEKPDAEYYVKKLDDNSVRVSAQRIIHKLYEYDKFAKIKSYFTAGKNVGIENPEIIPSGSLCDVFTRSDSTMYDQKIRTFQDEVFSIEIDGEMNEYKLTTQWQGFTTEGDEDPHGRQYLWALRDFVNYHYKDIFKVQNIGETAHIICYKDESNFVNYENVKETAIANTDYVRNDIQIIYYGVPGSGKSFGIDRMLEKEITGKEDREAQTKRVVFHPEYSNADFIGQILPKLNDKGVDYKFSAGPFTDILKKAYTNPQKKFFLIIEEINRGNAAAIFGDLFQLLDRDEETGFSSYSVNNDDVNYFIFGEGHLNEGIKLPPNLAILATMNTSDQNVFTLDNAFQRRWKMKLVENSFERQENDTDETVALKEIQRNAKIETNQKVTWESFQKAINIMIGQMALETGLSSMEDKRLGCWFVKSKKEDGKAIIGKTEFAEKVLKYLWDDAFKFSREKVFGDYKNLEELSNEFKKEGIGLKVFKNADELFELKSQDILSANESGEN